MKDNNNKIKTNNIIPPSNHKLKLFYAAVGLTITSSYFIYKVVNIFNRKLFDNNADITHICYFDLETKDTFLGRIDIGLFGNISDKAINNFLTLTEKKSSEKDMSYIGTDIFRMIPGSIVCLGDVKNNNGTGHYSIYNNNY